MRIRASIRPQGLRKGLTTKAFYKGICYKNPFGPDVRDVVGTLIMSATRNSDLAFLAAVHQFFITDKAASISIVIDGKEAASMSREAEPAADQQQTAEPAPKQPAEA